MSQQVERLLLPEKNSLHFQGSIVPMLTPLAFDSHDQRHIDKNAVESIVRHLINGNTSTIFILGTRGRFPILDMEEKETMIKATSKSIAHIDPCVPFIVGISGNTIDETVKLAQLAEQNNASAVVLTPLYGKGEPQDKLDRVLAATTLPVVLYNNPAITEKKSLPIEFVREASQREDRRVIGIKDSSGKDEDFIPFLELQNNYFSVVEGRTARIMESLRKGARGFTSVLANLYPYKFNIVYKKGSTEAFNFILNKRNELLDQNGDLKTAAVIYQLKLLGVFSDDVI